ncbi:hypothetical protein POV27_12885 [Aureisphaera galaxeae]|uniref:hypothetical protein n=1 Tax=Aureisphaera galaxeae TaxID=1538023 RepID=UPI002350C78D|nr:hypothetical protein [Aureisphaera galaxeae]MDC8004950.1 hypothetical protein [Aureisphaera galaxeae]
MKKILLFLLCTVVLSCDTSDDRPETDNSILDSWDMQSYIFFGPEPPELEEGDVIWSFSQVTNTLTIVNNVESDYPYLPESGTYSVTVLPDNVVIIEGLPWGNVYEYEVVGNELFLNFRDDPQIADDELSIVFGKRDLP